MLCVALCCSCSCPLTLRCSPRCVCGWPHCTDGTMQCNGLLCTLTRCPLRPALPLSRCPPPSLFPSNGGICSPLRCGGPKEGRLMGRELRDAGALAVALVRRGADALHPVHRVGHGRPRGRTRGRAGQRETGMGRGWPAGATEIQVPAPRRLSTKRPRQAGRVGTRRARRNSRQARSFVRPQLREPQSGTEQRRRPATRPEDLEAKQGRQRKAGSAGQAAQGRQTSRPIAQASAGERRPTV